ncbi:MAG TPA: hypothetical protein VFO79_13265 [Xanthomonadales bacterium]|nr:hypothetical protein [Xanthomonadales bacterium]
MCSVPSAQHDSIGAAVADGTCTGVALAAGSFAESVLIARSLDLAGSGSGTTTIEGRVEITGPVVVSIAGFSLVNGCAGAGLRVLAGADVSATDVELSPALVPCPAFADPLFRDGFESPGAAPTAAGRGDSGE